MKTFKQISIFFRIAIFLFLDVPGNQILLHFGVPNNQISLHFDVPNDQILLHFGVPDTCSSAVAQAWVGGYGQESPGWISLFKVVTFLLNYTETSFRATICGG